MELIRDLHNLKASHRACVATIGNFDGVHLGHMAILDQLHRQAFDAGLPGVVITFEPQPLEYFSPASAPARLTPFREKLELLQAAGIDRVLCLRFDRRLAEMPAAGFIRTVLVEGLGARRVIVGDDFRFGKGRGGNFETLVEHGQRHGFRVIPTTTRYHNGSRISSSRIREHLAAGEFEPAAGLLGRWYYISGRVIHGDKRGNELGYPTANVALNRKTSPLAGIYAVRVHGLDGGVRHGVASIGTRPVFDGRTELLEVHLFDFDGTIYGRRIRVEFRHYIRAERDFPTVTALVEQMHADADSARRFFTNNNESTAETLNPG